MEQRMVTRVWCEQKGALLLHRSAAGARRFANIHELPTPEQVGLDPAKVVHEELLAKKRRGITRFQITESIYATTAPKGKLSAELVWAPLDDLDSLTLSGPHRRWVREILARSSK
jgi:A/G-specific adenine glycosylase